MAWNRNKGAILVLILGCVGATASVRTAGGAPEIGEISRPDYRPAHGAGRASAIAAFDPTFDIQPDGSRAVITPRVALTSASAIVGTASFYEGAQTTSSGELYDPSEFTAAAQLEIRDLFGGIRYGKNYQPCYAIGEFAGKKIIVKFNDVGPLKPGRKFDLSRAAMAYFDETLETGLLPEFRMTPLPLGQTYKTGPVSDDQLVAMGIVYGDQPPAAASNDVPAHPEASGVDEVPAAETVADLPGMKRDDALQERHAFADPDAPAADTAPAPSEALLFIREAGSESSLVTVGDLIEAGRRLVALVGASIPSSEGDPAPDLERRHGKVEDGAGLADMSPAQLLL